MTSPVMAFTGKYDSISLTLKSKCLAISEVTSKEVIALWDTGATVTCISEEVFKDLKPVVIGKYEIRTPSGKKETQRCLMDIQLPNTLIVKEVPVCVTEIGAQGIGILIGMDIIRQGDFAVSNFNNHTVFTFRIPSQKTVDYVAEAKFQKVIGPKHGTGKRKKKKK